MIKFVIGKPTEVDPTVNVWVEKRDNGDVCFGAECNGEVKTIAVLSEKGFHRINGCEGLPFPLDEFGRVELNED